VKERLKRSRRERLLGSGRRRGGDGFFFTDLHLVLSKTDRRSREVLSLKKNRGAGQSRS